ncbi:paired box protein Pax-3-like [Acropora palmata]|uniref:paired box protein Pax-3-like n=1 Tax=Acropora palmata TaxID=6131 RepID=UPI003D9FF714
MPNVRFFKAIEAYQYVGRKWLDAMPRKYFLKMEDSFGSSSSAGPGRLNQLGRTYINGKPLPREVRHKIITLAIQGFRPCDISRRLRITHGCISKLLSKYRKTGSIQPGGEGVGRPRVITAQVAQRIRHYSQQQPGLSSLEIRDRLVQDDICNRESVPSLSSINRLLRKNNGSGELSSSSSGADSREQPANSSTYTIANILNLPSSVGQSSSSALSSAASCSYRKEKGIGDERVQTENVLEFEDLTDQQSSSEMFSPLQTQKRERFKYSEKQLKDLDAAFVVNQYPCAAERDQLAAKIGVTESKIQVWFSNRRVKCKSRGGHAIHKTNTCLTEPELMQCTCQRRNSDPLNLQVSPPTIIPGPSKIFFPQNLS